MNATSSRAPLLLAALLVLALGARPIAEVFVDLLWFDALGHGELFRLPLATRVALWLGAFLTSAGFIAANLRRITRRAPMNVLRLSALMGDQPIPPAQLVSMGRWLGLGWVLLPSMLFGNLAASQWLEVLSWREAQPFGTLDPVFGQDIAFYAFTLPVLAAARDLASGLVVLTLLPLAAYAFVRELAQSPGEPPRLPESSRAHLMALGAALTALTGLGWWLDRYALLQGRTGVVWGPGYADLNAALPAMGGMALLSGAIAVALVAARGRSWSAAMVSGAIYFIARVLLVGAWPSLVQEYFVKPSELTVEREFLERNIAATRAAYALDRVEVRPFAATADLTMADVEANPLTIDNVRVWDDRPLLETYRQIQEIRTYYEFNDVDVDRYLLDGAPRQVMLSARELSHDSLPARSWVNERLLYTHGYGLTMSPVNVVTPEGLPQLFVQDIPPETTGELAVTRPEIYYGELTDRWVLVRTSEPELDYPLGDQNVYTTYAGDGGVPVGGLARKVLFSVYLDSVDILLSQYLTPESRVMLRRSIGERVATLAPFLRYDADPYLVVAEGRLFWMIDAYTTTAAYPYAEPVNDGRGRFNYIRNSVKVVVDAFHGDVRFFVADAGDPIIRTYQRIFPEVFEPLEAMPEALAAHLRYPVDFFRVQARMFQAYHMTDATVFYNREDLWQFPKELYSGAEQEMKPYYLIMKLPDAEAAEFILLLPFVPSKKDNMIAWLAARCDPEVYGRLLLYQFPKQKLVYGPRQIEARIDQDPSISQEITLWSQSGSDVLRGNLLVIPIGDALMYVEPLYLQAESGKLPELKRVIVSYNNRIAMRPTLDEALAAVFDPAPVAEPPAPAPGEEGAEAPAPAGWAELALAARAAYDEALAHQRAGDWAAYGQALARLEALLVELDALAQPVEQ